MKPVLSVEGKTDNRHAFPRVCHRFFLDSGAHSLYTIHCIQKKHRNGYKWYKTSKFRKYLDRYATFVKKHKESIDWYANVDVIFEPKLSWDAQTYLEQEHGLKPVPVIHFNTDIKWIDKYLNKGHSLLGIGGLGQEATREDYKKWGDKLFAHLCSGKDNLPCVRTHGFAMTSYQLMTRYPWWSVDSASWAKCAAYGGIFVPHKRRGHFTFSLEPYVIGCSKESVFRGKKGKHLDTITNMEWDIISSWLHEIGVPLGRSRKKDRVEGVSNHYGTRAIANMRFFERLCSSLPKWPWSFTITPRRGFFQ